MNRSKQPKLLYFAAYGIEARCKVKTETILQTITPKKRVIDYCRETIFKGSPENLGRLMQLMFSKSVKGSNEV